MNEISIEQASKDAYALAIKIRCALNEMRWDKFDTIVVFSNTQATQERAEDFLDFLLEDVSDTSYALRQTCLLHAVDYAIGIIKRSSPTGKVSGEVQDKNQVMLYQKSYSSSCVIQNAKTMIQQHTQLQNYAMNKHMPSKKNKL